MIIKEEDKSQKVLSTVVDTKKDSENDKDVENKPETGSIDKEDIKNEILSDIANALKKDQTLEPIKTPGNIKSVGSDFEKFLLALQFAPDDKINELLRDDELAKLIPKDYNQEYNKFEGITNYYETKMKNFEVLKSKYDELKPKIVLFVKQNLV